MKILRLAAGLVCAGVGILPSYGLYALDNDEGSLELLSPIAVAAGLSFVIWTVCRRAVGPSAGQVLAGITGSYAIFILFVMLSGNSAETLMWLPIIVLVGIPFMAPVVGMSWVGSAIAFPFTKDDRIRTSGCTEPGDSALVPGRTPVAPGR